MFVRCGVFFFLEIVDVWQVWGIFFSRSSMFHLWQMDRTFWQMDHPFDKWTNLLTNGPTFWQMTHVFFSRFYVWIFHVKINLDHECLLGVGYFFLRSRMFVRCGFFLRSRMFVRCIFFFFEITNVWQVWVFFEITNVWQVWGCFWDHECLSGVGYFFFWEMWRESLIFERDDSWMWFAA